MDEHGHLTDASCSPAGVGMRGHLYIQIIFCNTTAFMHSSTKWKQGTRSSIQNATTVMYILYDYTKAYNICFSFTSICL